MERAIKQGDRRLAIGLTAMALALGAALPAGASQHEGVIDATVTVADAPEACLLVEIDTLDFSTRALGQTAGSQNFQIDHCGSSPQDLYAIGTNASLSDGLTSWQLSDEFPLGSNEYALMARSPIFFEDESAWLSANAAKLITPTMRISAPYQLLLNMPPAGSDGAGQVASFQVIWIAVFSG